MLAFVSYVGVGDGVVSASDHKCAAASVPSCCDAAPVNLRDQDRGTGASYRTSTAAQDDRAPSDRR